MIDEIKNEIRPQSTGWYEWVKIVVSNVGQLNDELKSLEKELKKSISNLEIELKTQDNKIDDIKISLEEIKRITDKIDNLKEKTKDLEKSLSNFISNISTIKEDIVSLKVKDGIWGGLSGLLSALAAAIIYALTK